MYIKRDLEEKFLSTAGEYSCVLVTGMRQSGKTTMLGHLMDKGRTVVTLDDLDERRLAQDDPQMFFQLHSIPIMIDEVQYAPELFSAIKIAIDKGAAPGSFWLTGSQPFRLMELAQESLAGRCAILSMPPLSQHEIYGTGRNEPFRIDINALKERALCGKSAGLMEIYGRIFRGSMPAFVSGRYTDRDVFYSSYTQTYIERDVKEVVSISSNFQFLDFIRASACRIGNVLNIHDLAKDVGVSDDTAKRWTGVLEKSGIIFFLRPYENNLLKRTIKAPKLYFSDTGLVAYLTRYSTPETLASGALAGSVLENYVVSEICKTYQNSAKECPAWYYRDKDGHEIDMVIEGDGFVHPIEIKRTANPGTELTGAFRILDQGSLKRGSGAVVCMKDTLSAMNADNFIVPIWMI